MFSHVRQDLRRCGDRAGQRWREVLINPGMWAVLGYRFRRWIYLLPIPRLVKKLFNPFATLNGLWVLIVTNIDLSATAEIGPGLYIPHTGYIVVGSGVKIGSNCTLTQGVTIGHAGGGQKGAEVSPILGSRVYVGPSAIIIGPVVIGNDALVGAGAVVVHSVRPGDVVVGNPARVISGRGSFDLITYTGMEGDVERAAAMERCRAVSLPADGVTVEVEAAG
jgi:serine O-acetyltransferase